MANGNVQTAYYKKLIDNKRPCTVVIKNGFQIRCTVLAEDSYTILVNNQGSEDLIYKSAISTVTPAQQVPRTAGAPKKVGPK